MGRKRKDNPFGLPARTYWKNGQFWYVHRNGKWEGLGTDVKLARAKGDHYNDSRGQYGTIGYFLDEFLAHFARLVLAGEKSQRTLDDYTANVDELKPIFGDMTPDQVKQSDIGEYLDENLVAGRGVRANREKACLSSAYTWMIRKGYATTNPCIGVRRNKETPRRLYVEDAHLAAVKLLAPPPVVRMLDLVYLTLQRPTDILSWSRGTIAQKGSDRVLRVQQHKTAQTLDIAITSDLAAIMLQAKGYYFISTGKGDKYTYDGLASMLKRAIKKADVPTFGFRDMKGKGATDMWRQGVPLERIQLLCGHDSVTTTERYIKAHWQETLQPNVSKKTRESQ